MYRLVFLSGRYQGKRLVVRQAVTLVGRDPQCHLVLPDDEWLSPQHARFEERGTGVFLTNLSTEHPVERNGEPLRETLRLAHNDLLVFGQTRLQFQDIIAPHARLHPSPGLLQPATWLMAIAILLLEVGLLLYLVNWPQHLIQPETESKDLARAEEIRAVLEAEKNAATGTVAQADASASVVALPGTTPRAPSEVPAPAAGERSAIDAGEATASPSNPILQVLDQADFVPADTNSFISDLPPVSAADPRIATAQRQLAEAVAAAQFADYAKAFRLLNQIHQTAPGFLPAHVEHARLLEARGDLDEAQQRWTQILGLAPAASPVRAQALDARQRLARTQSLQTQILRSAETSDLSALPRHVRIVSPEIQKMPADVDVAEMRILNATVEIASGAPLFKDALVQIFITFYDIDASGQILPTRAITPPSPIVLGKAFADRRSLPLEATYVVPRSLRAQEERTAGGPATFYGYAIHVFAGQILQDAAAKPKKLLELPIRLPAAALKP